MGWKIKDRSFFESRYLEVTSTGVTYYKAALTGGKHRFRFHQVDAILMAPDGVLSFQVAREVFSLKTKPKNSKHQQVAQAFVDGVRQAHGEA